MSGRDQKPKEEKKVTVTGPIPKEPKGRFVLGEVPTATDFVIMNKDNTEETYSVLTALCKIMNDVDVIKEELKKK